MLLLNFHPFPTISTERLFLRQLTKEDVPEIFRLRSDERVAKYVARAIFKTQDEADAFIDKISKVISDNESVLWGITLRGTDKVLGTICLWNFQKEHYRAEVGAEMHPDYWGKGIMQEAMAAIINYAFKGLRLHSLEGVTNPNNAASIKLLERNHFVKEAHFKENFYHNGVFQDTFIYSLILEK